MNIDEILDVIDELLDRSWSLPLSGGRCVVDADKVRDLIDDIRLNIPAEIKQAKAITARKQDKPLRIVAFPPDSLIFFSRSIRATLSCRNWSWPRSPCSVSG